MNRSQTVWATGLLFFVAVVSSSTSSSQSPNKDSGKSLLVAVWPGEKGKTPDTPLIDPIALLKGDGFQTPPEDKDSEAVWNQFKKTYYLTGKAYQILIHGSSKGTATVREATSISCVSLVATVSLSQPLPEDHMRIAASSLGGLGVHPDRDPSVTTGDRAAFLHVASAYFKKKGVDVPISRLKLDSLYSVSLNAALPNSLVGAITLSNKSAIRHLFLLATKTDHGYVADLTSYHVAKDVEDRTDDVHEDFVEHLDLDNDGSDEIITMMHYYESWNYNIYRKTNGVWKVVYNGGGGGC